MTRTSRRLGLPLTLVAVLAMGCSQHSAPTSRPGDPTVAPARGVAGTAHSEAPRMGPGPGGSKPADGDDDATVAREPFVGGEAAFAAVMKTLREKYYAAGISDDDLYRAAVQGVLERVEPRMKKWNKLLAPAEIAELRNDLKGELVGIGAQIKFDVDSGYTDVLGTLPGSPAERAGVVAGDKIVSIDGKLYKGMSLRSVVADIRGKAGETVTLSILRGDKLLPVTVRREIVSYDAVSAFSLGDGVGYVRVRFFSLKTQGMLRGALDDLSKKGARGLVVDLRGNQGGGFDDAVASADLLLPAGAGIVSLEKRGEKAEVRVAKGGGALASSPMVVLVDHSTSSGAELVAAALREGRRAQVVGERTFGKWSVQKIEDLPNGYAYKFTVGLFHTPSGKSFEGVGMTPDVTVDSDGKQLEAAQAIVDPVARLAADAPLRTAVALLRRP